MHILYHSSTLFSAHDVAKQFLDVVVKLHAMLASLVSDRENIH
jgi:hypothetical protein